MEKVTPKKEAEQTTAKETEAHARARTMAVERELGESPTNPDAPEGKRRYNTAGK